MDETLPEGDFPNAFLSLVMERFFAAKAIHGIVASHYCICDVQNSSGGSHWAQNGYHHPIHTDKQ
jgi:hypothetical protein